MTEPLSITYVFTGFVHTASIALKFDADTMHLHEPPREILPEWTRLEVEQCGNCPLRPEQTAYCPIARNLLEMIELCSDFSSYDALRVDVSTQCRNISMQTTAQRALSSLAGLIMATSACPRTDFLRPMARFHLPLADELETQYRILSTYLMAQFMRHRAGLPASFDVLDLDASFRELQTVNACLARRLRVACKSDASVNAVILLDLFAKGVPHSETDFGEQWRQLFSYYLGIAVSS